MALSGRRRSALTPSRPVPYVAVALAGGRSRRWVVVGQNRETAGAHVKRATATPLSVVIWLDSHSVVPLSCLINVWRHVTGFIAFAIAISS